MRIISADSAAAILDEQFKPVFLVASVSVLVEPPYREPSFRLAEPIFREVEDGFEVIVHEAELCRSLLDKMKADVVHLDMSLGGISIEELSPVELTNLEHQEQDDKTFSRFCQDSEKLLVKSNGSWHRHVGYWQRKCSCADCRVNGWCRSNSVCMQKSGG